MKLIATVSVLASLFVNINSLSISSKAEVELPFVPAEFTYKMSEYSFDDNVPGVLTPQNRAFRYQISTSRNIWMENFYLPEIFTNKIVRNYGLGKLITNTN